MAIRIITFEATLDGISPKAPQNAGIQGEHNATTVVIMLSTQLITELNKPNTYYRFEFVDCMGQFDTTENFTLSSGAIGVNIDIPNGWTSSGGNAELRLVIVKLNVDNNEEMILYSLPCKLKFEGRDTGTGLTPETVEKGLSGLIADAKTATESANSAASSAINAANTAFGAGDYAQLRAGLAENAAQIAETKGNYAKLQGDYAKEKGDYASNAAADVNTAISNATSATNAANIAASSADAAASAANTAANAASQAANSANTAAANANTAADNANAAYAEASSAAVYANQAADNANQAAEAARQALDDIENMVADGVATANSYTDTVAAGKVDKVAGKGLSTNDYTNTDKAKVDNLPLDTGAALAQKADKVQEAWITPTLLNGWTQTGTFTPQYYKDQFGIVRLRGRVSSGTVGTAIFSLPVGYRPGSDAVAFPVSANWAYGSVYISKWTGDVIFNTGNNANVTLDGISFRAEA